LPELKREFAAKTVLKAIADTRIVGAVRACHNGETAYIGRLCVAPYMQNRGIGSGLMKTVERCFEGCRRYELFTGARSEKNLYLYQKLGYRVLRRSN
jgi:ribosomal protein S18 acetylase RimI-like enzyme